MQKMQPGIYFVSYERKKNMIKLYGNQQEKVVLGL